MQNKNLNSFSELPNVTPKSCGFSSMLIVLLMVLISLISGAFLGVAFFAPMIYEIPSVSIIVTSRLTPTFASPSVAIDPTVNWITSGVNGYKIKIPNSWKEIEHSSNFENMATFQAQDGSQFVMIVSKENAASLSEWLINKDKESQTAYEGTPSITVVDSKNIKINGLEAIERKERWNAAAFSVGAIKVTYLWANGKTVTFEIIPTDKKNKLEDQDVYKVFDQILSTFKFTENVMTDQPEVVIPSANSKVTSPLIVKGKVPAGWMFEGQFPVKLMDVNKNIIASSSAKEVTPGSWTSGKAVDFQATLTFFTSEKSGLILLEKDNPSGDPAKAKSFSLPVSF